MSPRHHPPRDDPEPVGDIRARLGLPRMQRHRDGVFMVRSVPGQAATKAYRCPGCDHEIPPGVPHVVVWPADELGSATDRRHWHSGCWRTRSGRGWAEDS